MNKAGRVSLAVGAVAIVGVAAFVLGNYLLPGGLFQSALISPVDTETVIGDGFGPPSGVNFTVNPNLTIDNGSIAMPSVYAGSRVDNNTANDGYPDRWYPNPDATWTYQLPEGHPNKPIIKIITDSLTSKKRLLMDARDKSIEASMRQINYLPPDRLKIGDKFVLRAWVSSANNADQDAQVRLSLLHNSCNTCFGYTAGGNTYANYAEAVQSGSPYLPVAGGAARMITTSVMTVTKEEVMSFDGTKMVPDVAKIGTGTVTPEGYTVGLEGNMLAYIAVKPGHAAFVDRIEVVKVSSEDSKILANGDFPADNTGYVRTIQPNLAAGAPKYLPAGWSSQPFTNSMLSCGNGSTAITNTGAGIRIDSGANDGCIYQYKVQGDWNFGLGKYVSDVKVGDEYVAKATVQGIDNDAYLSISASHITEPDLAKMTNYDFDHVKVWGTAKKDTPTVLTTTPLRVTSEDATGLHVLGTSISVYGPSKSALVTKVEMIKCTKDANGDYQQADCKSNSGTTTVMNAGMKIDQGITYNSGPVYNKIAADGNPDSWNIGCKKSDATTDANPTAAINITAEGATVQLPDDASYCDVYQMLTTPMVKDDTYVSVTRVKVAADQAISSNAYTQLGHNSPWTASDRSNFEFTPQSGNTEIDLGNGLYEFVSKRLHISKPNLGPGQHPVWPYRTSIVYRVARTTAYGVPTPPVTIVNMDIVQCGTLDKSSDKFKNYCVQDILPAGTRVSTNGDLLDSIGLLVNAIAGDLVPDGWTAARVTPELKDNIKYVKPTHTINAFQLSNKDIPTNVLLYLTQAIKTDTTNKKYMAVAQLQSADAAPIAARFLLSHNLFKGAAGGEQTVDRALTVDEGISGVGANPDAHLYPNLKMYTTPILSVTTPTKAGSNDLDLVIHPAQNATLNIQRAKVVEVADSDLETIRNTLQLKPTLNGSFEKDNGTDYGYTTVDTLANNSTPDGWGRSGCAADTGVTAEDKTEGTNSLRLTQAGTGLCMFQQPSTAPIKQGDLYVLSAKVKNIGTRDGVFQMRWVHNFFDADLQEGHPTERYTGKVIAKGGNWETVKYATKIRIKNADAATDFTSMTELFNVTNSSGLLTPGTDNVPLLVDDVKLTNCTQNPTAPECVNTPDESLAPTNQLLYNPTFEIDNGKLPFNEKEKLIVGNNNVENDSLPDGWFVDGWAGPNAAVKVGYEDVLDIDFSNGSTSTNRYFKIDTTAVPSSQTPLTLFIQTRYIPTQKGEKYRAVAMVRTASENNTPVRVAMNLEHNPYQVPRPAEDFAHGSVVAGNALTRLETGILTISTDDKVPEVNMWDRGNLGVGIYLERNQKVLIDSVYLYKVPSDFTELVANKNATRDDGSVYTFGEISANKTAGDKIPDGWRSYCKDGATAKESLNSSQFFTNGQKYYFQENVYITAFPTAAEEIGAGKKYTTALSHYNAVGKAGGYLDKPEYAAAIQQLAPGYNEDAYLLAFPDVAKSVGPGRMFMSGLEHYIPYGKDQNGDRLTKTSYASAVAALGAFDKPLFTADAGYQTCQIEQVQNTSTKIGDEYVAYAKVKNVSLTSESLKLILAHNWWHSEAGVTTEPSASSITPMTAGQEVTMRTGKLKIAYPDANNNMYSDTYKLGLILQNHVPAVVDQGRSKAFKILDTGIVNCTKEPTNEYCLPTPDLNLIGKGNQILVNTDLTSDSGSIPQANIGRKMNKLPNDGIPDGWNDDTNTASIVSIAASGANGRVPEPVVKIDGTTGLANFKQAVKVNNTLGKKYQAVFQVRTANPANLDASFNIQLYHNPYAGTTNTDAAAASYKATGTFQTFVSPVLTVTKPDVSPASTSGFDNLFFNIFPSTGNMIYIQKVEVFELVDDANSLVQNGSFEKDDATRYISVVDGNATAGDKIPDGWHGSAATGVTMVTTPVKSGQNAVSIASETQQGGKSIIMSLDTPTTVGDKYVAVANVYSAAPAAVGIKLMHNASAPKAEQSSPVTNTLTASGSTWTKLISQKMTISKPDVATGDNLELSVSVLSPNSTVIVDDVSLINCTKNPTVSECTAVIQQNPILTNGNFELDNGTIAIEALGDSTVNGIPDTWSRDCMGNGTMSSVAGKTGTGMMLSNTGAAHCLYQYTNVQPIKDHVYVATADVKSASNNIYTLDFILSHNPNVTDFLETAENKSQQITQNWKTVSSGPLKIVKADALPEKMPYNIFEKFGVILRINESGANVIFDNVIITDCTLSPTATACTQAQAKITAVKSTTMSDGILVKGQTAQKVGALTLTAENSDTVIHTMKFTLPNGTSGFSNFTIKNDAAIPTIASGTTSSGNVLFQFGGSPVPKNTPLNYSVYADVAANAAAPLSSSGSGILQLSLAENGIGFQDQVFIKQFTSTSPAISLQKMQLNTTAPAVVGSLAVTKATQFADQTVTKSGSNQKIGSFAIKATGESYKVESIAMKLSGINGVTNLYLTSSGQTLGTTVTSPALTNMFAFANTPVYVAKDATVTVDVFATIASTSTMATLQTSLDANAIAAKSNTNAVLTAPANTTLLQVLTLNGTLLPSAPTTTSKPGTNTGGTYVGAGNTGSSAGLGQLPSGTGGGVSTIVCPPSCETAVNPKDVSSTHFAYNAVKYLSARGILKGYSDNTFRVENAINRAEFVKIVSNGFKLTTTEKSAALPFKDVRSADWFYSVLRTVFKAGLVKGYASGDFLPAKNIQRDEAVKIMALADAATAIKLKNKNLTDTEATAQAETLITNQWNTWKASHAGFTYVQFSDASVNAWYAKYLLYAVEKGYISGRTVNGVKVFAPADQITRGEAAVLIARIIDANKITYPAEKKADNTFTVKFPE
ncbi:MAG: S-layer homology domain-containing protein [Candidatus Gracilibacteria bacterium]